MHSRSDAYALPPTAHTAHTNCVIPQYRVIKTFCRTVKLIAFSANARPAMGRGRCAQCAWWALASSSQASCRSAQVVARRRRRRLRRRWACIRTFMLVYICIYTWVQRKFNPAVTWREVGTFCVHIVLVRAFALRHTPRYAHHSHSHDHNAHMPTTAGCGASTVYPPCILAYYLYMYVCTYIRRLCMRLNSE